MTWHKDDEPKLWELIPPWVFALGRLSLRLAVIGTICGVLILVTYGVLAANYEMKRVVQMPERTLLLDRDGEEMAAIHGDRRRIIPSDQIPQSLLDALTTREDKDFYRHRGVHFRGILRAALRNLKDRGFTQGASTITMQLARNTYEMRAHSFHRKFLEAAISFRIEVHYSKEEIITAYLNRIYFGAGAYGIEQAAQSYFGKKAAELSVAEGALLVGIIRAPHDFSPHNDLEAALRERDQVLKQMARDGKLSDEERDRALATPVVLQETQSIQTDAIRCTRRHLNELLEKNDFVTGGLTATSTIDRNLQQYAREEMNRLLAPYPNLQGALVAIESSSGAIRAVITARDPNSSQFNRAFDTRRQLGPVFQPFLYAFSAERGRLPIPGHPLQTARQLSSSDIQRLAKRLGLTGPFAEGDDLARGFLQATTLEVATALSVLSNKGKKANTYLITELLDSDNKSLFQQILHYNLVLDAYAATTPVELTSQETWSAINQPGNDLWTLHTSPHLAIALWIGFDNPAKIPDQNQLTKGTTHLVNGLVQLARQKAEQQKN